MIHVTYLTLSPTGVLFFARSPMAESPEDELVGVDVGAMAWTAVNTRFGDDAQVPTENKTSRSK